MTYLLPGRLLVIGGRGFVGSRVLRRAAEQGVALASFGPEGGPDLLAGLDVRQITGSVETPGALAEALAVFCPDAVLWAAGHNPVGDGLAQTAQTDIARAVAINAGGFAAVLGACAAAGIRRVVQCGSTVVYGPAADYAAPRVAEDAPPAPRGAYGLSKRMAEVAADWGATALGLDVATLRLPLVTGPGRWYVGAAVALARMVDAAAQEAALSETVPNWRFDTVHADDAAEVLLRLCAHTGGPRLFNLAGLTTTHTEAAAMLGRLSPCTRIAVTEAVTPAPFPLVDDSLLRATLEWAPRHNLRDILADALRDAAAARRR
jgi:UDP-glucose 4-epimerase